MASLQRCLPPRPQGRRRRPGRMAGSPSAARRTRSLQRSWCVPGHRHGSPATCATEGVLDRRTQEAGTGGRWGGSRAPGCLSGFQNATKAQNQGTAAAPLDSRLGRLQERGMASGTWDWRRPRGFTARSASEVRSGHGCSSTQRSSASPPRNCQRSPGSDTSRAALPAAVLGGGRGYKSPASQPIRCLFLGEAGTTPPLGADSSANRHREATGNSGSCSQPRMNAANFRKRV